MRVENLKPTKMPLISVITPTKNRAKLLPETMNSVATQTFTDWEHIIVDDGSDDGTEAFVRERASSDPRVRYIRRTGEKAGANVCRNRGIREARADLIVFLDSDDLLAPAALGRRAATMQRNADLDFVVFYTGVFRERLGDIERLDPRDILGDHLLQFLSFEHPWQTTAPTWRRSALEGLGGFDEALPSWQDIDLHVRGIASGLRYIRFRDVDHFMRWQNDPDRVSIRQRRSMEHLRAAVDIFAKFEAVVRDGPGMNWNRQRALCGLYFFVAELMLEAGERDDASACWSTARGRHLAGAWLHLQGRLLLALLSAGAPGRRIGKRLVHKWKGWVRFRTIPELVRR